MCCGLHLPHFLGNVHAFRSFLLLITTAVVFPVIVQTSCNGTWCSFELRSRVTSTVVLVLIYIYIYVYIKYVFCSHIPFLWRFSTTAVSGKMCPKPDSVLLRRRQGGSQTTNILKSFLEKKSLAGAILYSTWYSMYYEYQLQKLHSFTILVQKRHPCITAVLMTSRFVGVL